MSLTDIVCKTAKPADKSRKILDNNGLYLEVMPSGGKYWRYKIVLAEKKNVLHLVYTQK